ncbi:MAG: Polyphosphate kinase [uncultured Acidimicrobiales bacterium]|uniref:Polyphosphate kinase n=1 Tax=uncultured Acidimicrobiales bacterium TaxID=310071 RepID=A0A6J4HYZ7_9ACTN|nr:MAG: Polyphosphate kinase [uncultured Acidimicrobiales bacterium]
MTDLDQAPVEAPADAEEPRPDPDGRPRYINRELSWLDFNARVLALAEDGDTPVLERAKFLAIFSSNLDEFFQVRVAALHDKQAAGLGMTSLDGLTPAEQLRVIRPRVEELIARQAGIFLNDVAPALGQAGIVLSDWESLDDDDREYLVDVFNRRIFPVLTPLAVDPGHPFPYISNLSLNLAVSVRDPGSGARRFARLKVPPLLPRFVVMPDGERFVAVEQVIAAHLDSLFPGMEIEKHDTFRVTRNADVTLEDDEEADDLLAAVELELRRRRFGRAVRLEVATTMSDETRELLLRELELSADDVYVVDGPLELSGLMAVYDLDRPDLKDSSWVGVTQPRLVDEDGDACDIFAVLREREVLVHHPYDSFSTSVVAFIEQAASDPQVLAIKQTLYRTSGDSPIIKALIRAAETGKQVAALVELKARFDEQANIAWARALEEAGVHVVYGLVGLKTHAKTALVVREEGDSIRHYCHVGTGNYNPKTARIYEDIGLLSADAELGADLAELFNYLTGYSRQTEYRKLLVAPAGLRQSIVELIAAEHDSSERNGRIVMKMNNLVDTAIIDALYEASQAGVDIDLIVRGICCLRPGVPGLSENIKVRSVVGRYLEHSRILTFGERGRRRYLIGSADLMPRNLDRRVEAMTPVEDPDLQARLQEVLDVNLADDLLAWRLAEDGSWAKVPSGDGLNTHLRLQELAFERARRRRSPDPRRAADQSRSDDGEAPPAGD